MSDFDRFEAHRSKKHGKDERGAGVPGKATLTESLAPLEPEYVLRMIAEHDAEEDLADGQPVVRASAAVATDEDRDEGAEIDHPDAGQEAGAPVDWKLIDQRTRQFERLQRYLKQRSKKRKQLRKAGKNWKLAELNNLLTAAGPEGVICALNKREAKQGIHTLGAAWSALIDALPIGTLQVATRHALDQMVADGVFHIEDEKRLFHCRFAHAAEDVSATWSQGAMKTLWRQIAGLPLADVTLNTVLTVFQAITGGTSYGPSWEAPESVNTIQIGQDGAGDPEGLEHTVRHEIGHAVHAMIPDVVNAWLQNDMGFWFADWDQWINELGGYPAGFNGPAGYVPMDDQWRTRLRGMVESFTGSASWSPAKASPADGEQPDAVAAWNAMPEAVKNACAQSKTSWYDNYKKFQLVGDKRYFLNHWYHRPFTLGPVAFACVEATNDSYSAMSEKEFFANCYAEYFQDPLAPKEKKKHKKGKKKKHKQKPQKLKKNWGGKLPSTVKTFFDSCVVQRQPYDIFKTQPRATK